MDRYYTYSTKYTVQYTTGIKKYPLLSTNTLVFLPAHKKFHYKFVNFIITYIVIKYKRFVFYGTCCITCWLCVLVDYLFQKCKKKYQCGHHVCEKECHVGECGDCPRAGERVCPCGRTRHTLPCTKDVPTCGDTCGKVSLTHCMYMYLELMCVYL